MKTNKTVCAMLWLAMTTGVAWAQNDPQQTPGDAQQTPGDTQQTPDDSQRTAPPAAFGPENPPVIVNENPPISGLDQPSLEPNFQPRSMLVGGVEGSESLDSNIGSDARPALHSVTRGLGGLTMQRLWRRYQLAAAYVGGVGYYNRAGEGLKQIQKVQAQQSILWRTGQLTMRDSFSYLPEGSFGAGAFGGSGGFPVGTGQSGRRHGHAGRRLGRTLRSTGRTAVRLARPGAAHHEHRDCGCGPGSESTFFADGGRSVRTNALHRQLAGRLHQQRAGGSTGRLQPYGFEERPIGAQLRIPILSFPVRGGRR